MLIATKAALLAPTPDFGRTLALVLRCSRGWLCFSSTAYSTHVCQVRQLSRILALALSILEQIVQL